MNDLPDPPPADEPPLVLPARQPSPRRREYAPPPSPPQRGGGKGLLIFFLLGSLGLNFLLLMILFFSLFAFGGSSDDGPYMVEKFYSNDATADDKVAIIHIDGVLLDETMGYAHKQIDKAAKDPAVKAVVVRINSPGGTITASDELHKRLVELRDGRSPRVKNGVAKPMVVSMGAMAASGGYYIAMPGKDKIFAEKTTITGSIGVYVSLPNVQKLANDHGVKMNLVRAGDVKASGSMFHELTPAERQQWQDMVDDSYAQFLKIVEEGRPQLKGLLTKELTGRTDANGNPRSEVALPRDDKGNIIPDAKPVPYKRKLADGGIFTAQEAKQLKLIDSIGYLEDAAAEAAKTLTRYKVVTYERPPSIFNLLGGSAKAQAVPDWSKLAVAAGPRLWYMAPNAELSGILAAMGKD